MGRRSTQKKGVSSMLIFYAENVLCLLHADWEKKNKLLIILWFYGTYDFSLEYFYCI